MLQSSDSTFKEMEERMHHLQYCLCEETKNCNQLKEQLEALRENHLSELRIKDKIVEEQNKTISKQKKVNYFYCALKLFKFIKIIVTLNLSCHEKYLLFFLVVARQRGNGSTSCF